MKHEIEFRNFLTTRKVSSKTGRPYSLKVANDVVSRCKLVERVFEIDFSEHSITPTSTERLCEQIKLEQTTSTDRAPYAYNALILAVRTYLEFLDIDFKQSSTSS
ncbi:hypothetical protein MCEMIEM13_02457 [Comamonadaceae bacterium]